MSKFDQTGGHHRHHQHNSHGRALFHNDPSLGGLFHRCAHLLYHQSGGAHPGQRRVLQLLAEQGQLSQKDLQERLNIQSGSVSELISKLEAKGFVQRQRDEQDRRKVLLVLTEAGRAHAEPAPGAQTQEQLFSALTEEEQQTLRKLLEKLEQSWSQPG